jgi:hemerythrin
MMAMKYLCNNYLSLIDCFSLERKQMAYIDWLDSYSVGVVEMDNQHKKLIDLINQLHDSMKAGKGNSEISVILNGLSDYTKYHFNSEEKILQENNYPGFIFQQNKHKEFVEKLKEFQQEAGTKSLSISIQVSQFLKTWLVEHILVEDKKYGKYLNGKGIH